MKKLALCFLAALALGCLPTARAVYVLTLQEVGPNVVASGSGSINTYGLAFVITGSYEAFLRPSDAGVGVGRGTDVVQGLEVDGYFGAFGPTSLGPGAQEVPASSTTGDATMISGGFELAVPERYVSGSPLAGTATFDDQSLATLGFTPGTYVYTWGNGANADSFTVIGVVPEPSTWALLSLGALGAGVLVLRRWPRSEAMLGRSTKS